MDMATNRKGSSPSGIVRRVLHGSESWALFQWLSKLRDDELTGNHELAARASKELAIDGLNHGHITSALKAVGRQLARPQKVSAEQALQVRVSALEAQVARLHRELGIRPE